MSVMMLTDRHFQFLAQAAMTLRLIDQDDVFDTAQEMKLWNERAIAACYREDLEHEPLVPVLPSSLAGRIEDGAFVFKQARCFAYQACDAPRWDDSAMASMIDALVEQLGLSPEERDAALDDGEIPWGIR